jgi:hypothetical protein
MVHPATRDDINNHCDGALGACQPRQQAALRPAAANGLGAQSRPVDHRQADDAVARGAAITKCRYRRRDSDPLRRHPRHRPAGRRFVEAVQEAQAALEREVRQRPRRGDDRQPSDPRKLDRLAGYSRSLNK